jgi:antitoxin MazE
MRLIEMEAACIFNVDTMRARIQKWGNSLALRIPRGTAEEAGLAQGSEVELRVEKGKLIVQPKPPKVYRLADLLRGVRKSNLHGEIDFGPPVGRELL